LGEIKEGTDFLKELSDESSDRRASLSDATNSFDNALVDAKQSHASVLDSFASIAGSYTNTPPAFIGSGEHTFSANIYGSTVSLDFSMIADLRQYFDIVFILLLAYLNFKIYLWIFKLLVKMGA
jgi:hypothetical protein